MTKQKHWRKLYPDFPQPVATVSGTLVWDWADIEAIALGERLELAFQLVQLVTTAHLAVQLIGIDVAATELTAGPAA